MHSPAGCSSRGNLLLNGLLLTCVFLTRWQVLLFYPDGKRSSSSDPQLGPGDAVAMHHAAAAVPPPGMIMGAAAGGPPVPALPHGAGAGAAGAAGGGAAAAAGGGDGDGAGAAPAAAGGAAAGAPGAMMPGQHHGHPGLPAAAAALQLARMAPPGRRDTTNEYAALFVALIGEGPNPQGVVNTNEGKVVRAFHRFTLVDQTGQGRDLTKGRTREAGAVKISCARQDPNARNCHGYRKFVKVRAGCAVVSAMARGAVAAAAATAVWLCATAMLPNPAARMLSITDQLLCQAQCKLAGLL